MTNAEVLAGNGQIVGTMQYMPSRQLPGKDADHSGDVFQLIMGKI